MAAVEIPPADSPLLATLSSTTHPWAAEEEEEGEEVVVVEKG